MTTRLHLISLASTAAMRKGRFPANEPLDERGRTETLATGLITRFSAPAALLCSPAAIAQDTAALWPCPAKVELALADTDYGSWQGRALAELLDEDVATVTAWARQADIPAGGAESFTRVLARVGGWLDQLDQSGEVVALTHPPVIRAVILHVLRAPADCFHRIEVPPLSCFELRRSRQGWAWWPGVG